MGRPSRYAPEIRARAVRMVREHEREYPSQWAAIGRQATRKGTMCSDRMDGDAGTPPSA